MYHWEVVLLLPVCHALGKLDSQRPALAHMRGQPCYIGTGKHGELAQSYIRSYTWVTGGSSVAQVSGVLQEAEARKEAELAAQMEAALEGDEDEEQRLIEERRKRRQQILAKHQQDRELSGALSPPHSTGPSFCVMSALVLEECKCCQDLPANHQGAVKWRLTQSLLPRF